MSKTWANDHTAVRAIHLLCATLLLFATSLKATPACAATARIHLVLPADQTPQEQALTTMFMEELHRREQLPTVIDQSSSLPPNADRSEPIVLIGARNRVQQLMPAELKTAWQRSTNTLHPTLRPEGFTAVTLPWRGASVTVLAGNDVRGELFAVGWLLRQLNFATGSAQIPAHIAINTAPEKTVRSHQLGYRPKNNTYDAWNLAQFEQQIRDLAIFGGNAVQVISPTSDDAAVSPLYPAPALDTVVGISAILAKYGLDCDLYYPEIRQDYSRPDQVQAELAAFEALVKAMPRIDALHVPGGDPGHTPPELLFPLVMREAEILRRYHPGATVWVSGQGFDRAHYEAFYSLLRQRPAWLTGVFFGPQSRDSFETQRRRIPATFQMQFYPDIAHTMHAQFPVPQWDPAFALSEGREPVCPRPSAFQHIYQHFQPLFTGFVTYSEGVNDDINKILWNQLGWSSATPVDTVLGEYARWFLHREGPQQTMAVQAMHGLEQDWVGLVTDNMQIPATARLLQTLERQSDPLQVVGNGRWESLLYRGFYDDYVQRKVKRQRAAQAAATMALVGDGTASDRVAAARKAIADGVPDEAEQYDHDRLFELADKLFRDWGLQLSVKLYGASNWERGANLDRVDTPLAELPWLLKSMDAAMQHPLEIDRDAALQAIVDWQRPSAGVLYDDLGDPVNEPHLLRGQTWHDDPEMYATSIDGIADRTLDDGWRTSWIDYAETLYETPLRLQYKGLNPAASYTVRITYAGEDYALPLRLVANGRVEIHAARLRKGNPETVEFPVPAGTVKNGTLLLEWTGPEGSGGSGRGRQVAEVWLLKH